MYNVSTFTIPYYFKSFEGTLRFYYVATIEPSGNTPQLAPGLLKVSMCTDTNKQVEVKPGAISFTATDIPYSCSSSIHVEGKTGHPFHLCSCMKNAKII